VRRVFERGAYADHALQAEASELDARDRALAMQLAYGTVQRRRTLDHVIEGLAERSVRRLDAPVLAALRLGTYELLYLDGSPDYAVVADAVELAKEQGRAGHGLVNAVLRRAAREGPEALLGTLTDATPEQAAVKHSHPDWIARLFFEQLGGDAARALMACDNEPAEVALRANTLVTDAATLAWRLADEPSRPPLDAPAGCGPHVRGGGSVRTHLDPAIPEALVLDGPFDLHGSPLWRDGAFLAQSRAAMLVARALGPRAGERVLDLCAAPGGKATHLAALMDGSGEVVAVELNPRRAEALVRTARRLGALNVKVEVGDATLPRADRASFDRVLVDPPCSGLGTLQARPDLRWRATLAGVAEMAGTQAALLAAGAGSVRPGGVLVYSTCTISPPENEHVIGAFLHSHPEFSLDDLAAELPSYALERSRPSQAAHAGKSDASSSQAPAAGLVLTLPHRDHTAGFFIARLRRS